MSIIVKNQSSKAKVKVSINVWGGGGNTSYYSISSGQSEKWDRTDPRGFVMYIIESVGLDGPYYVLPDTAITIHNDWVEGALRITNMPKLKDYIALAAENVKTLTE